ncbi:hypothetical protein A343_1511 [Porphyromonas gingivalis JCVI SC001]|nr:hypothetical protein A343_1511 [Porphyromonas gingivalis JCVI SC001]
MASPSSYLLGIVKFRCASFASALASVVSSASLQRVFFLSKP